MVSFNQNVQSNIHNFLLTATPAQIRKEIVLSLSRNDIFRAQCCLEVLIEELTERTGTTLHEFVKKHDSARVREEARRLGRRR